MHHNLPTLVPSEKSPFEGDKLDRPGPAFILKSIIETFEEGCVVSLNGKWGTGKTTFLSMWEKYMATFGYRIIHYNAWESDYVSDPLVAFIAEFRRFAETNNIEKAKKVLGEMGKITLSMLPIIAGELIKHFTGVDAKELIEKGGDVLINTVNKEIDNYFVQKETLTSFKKELSDYISEISDGKSLILVVDELDRCNPKFAVNTLERIKHIFAVPNIAFVLSIDEEQLCNSIKGYFGNNDFDAKDYLRRFVDIPYYLPVGNVSTIIDTAMIRFNYQKLFMQETDSKSYLDMLHGFFELLYHGRNLSIRQLEKWMLYSRLVLSNQKAMDASKCTIVFLVFLKFFDTTCYKKFISYEMDENEFIKYIEDNFCDSFFDVGGFNTMYYFYPAIAELLVSRYAEDAWEEKIVDSQGNLKFKIKKFNEDKFINTIQGIIRSKYRLRIDWLVRQIDLIGNIG